MNSNNYDLVERVTAGYLMNTIELTNHLRFAAGVRFEATHLNTLSFDESTTLSASKPEEITSTYCPALLFASPSTKTPIFALYMDAGLPVQIPRTDLGGSQIVKGPPDTLSLGNPNLKAEYANNYDVLYERYLNPLGLIQAGYFYKDLSNPIVTKQTITSNSPYDPGNLAIITQPVNAGSAHVQGVESGFQQRLSYLPGVMGGSVSRPTTATQTRPPTA